MYRILLTSISSRESFLRAASAVSNSTDEFNKKKEITVIGVMKIMIDVNLNTV